MKKIIALLLVLALGLSLCACGGTNTEEPTKHPLYKTLSRKMGIDFMEQDVEEICIDEESASVYLNNCDYLDESYVVELGNGTTLQFPMTYGELCDAGWSLLDAEIGDYIPTEYGEWFEFVNSNGKTIEAYLCNISDSPVELRNVPVTMLEFGDTGTESFSINGIQKGSTVKEILAEFGLPYGSSFYEWENGYQSFAFYYTGEDIDCSIHFDIDPKTGRLDHIWYSWY